jgi:hypothetical protein
VTAGTVINDLASPTAVAPDSPARPAFDVRIRTRAAVALLACVASLGSLGSYAWLHRVGASELEAPPFKIDDAAWRSVLTVAATKEPSCPPSAPLVILYVSGSCFHCQAEIMRWSNLIRSGTPEMRCIGLAVVAAPRKANSPPHWLPAELTSRLLWDHDGTVARVLHVRLVPLAAYVTSTGVVITRVVGEASNEETTIRHLLDLRQISDADKGIQ